MVDGGFRTGLGLEVETVGNGEDNARVLREISGATSLACVVVSFERGGTADL